MNNLIKSLLICVVLFIALAVTGCAGGTATAVPTPPPPTIVPATIIPDQPTVVVVAPTLVPPPTAAPVQATLPPATKAPTAVPPTKAPTTAPTAVAPTVAVATATPQVEPTTAQADAFPTFIPASEWKDPSPDKFTREDVDYIFPPGKGQDLVFQACTSCHNWVPIILAGYDRNAWTQNKLNHRERAMGLSNADYDYLYEYLIRTWPPDRPVPDNIPQDLLDQWTSY